MSKDWRGGRPDLSTGIGLWVDRNVVRKIAERPLWWHMRFWPLVGLAVVLLCTFGLILTGIRVV